MSGEDQDDDRIASRVFACFIAALAVFYFVFAVYVARNAPVGIANWRDGDWGYMTIGIVYGAGHLAAAVVIWTSTQPNP